MKNPTAILALMVAIVALAMVWLRPSNDGSVGLPTKQETVFDHVMRTGTIRCGYAVWHPALIKDPNTGVLSGYDYDVVNAVGEVLGLKVEWVEETGWGTATEALASRRFDMACNSFWGPPGRTRAVMMSVPFIHHPLFVVTNDKIKPEGAGVHWLNSPAYKMLILRGTIGENEAKMVFPNAHTLDAAELSSDGNALLDVSLGKADFTIANLTPIQRFLEHGGKGIKIIEPAYAVVGGMLLLPPDDVRFKHMIDSALSYLIDSGKTAAILRKYMGDDMKQWTPTAPSYVPQYLHGKD